MEGEATISVLQHMEDLWLSKVWLPISVPLLPGCLVATPINLSEFVFLLQEVVAYPTELLCSCSTLSTELP